MWLDIELVFVNLFKEDRNRFTAWRACTTTLFDVPARQATQAGVIDSYESIPGVPQKFTNSVSGLRCIRG
jgi:hypothetical protein